MKEATMNDILEARENRAKKHKDLLSSYCCPLISFTMNIAGPIKNSPLIEHSFYEGIRLLEENLPPKSVIHQEISIKNTGCESLFCVMMDATKLKNITTSIEETSGLGRLFDMDVIDTDGIKLERKVERKCLVCGAPGRACAAGRVHPVSVLQSVTKEMMENYFFLLDKERFSNLAAKSLSDEVYTTPKPGLVDKRNNGSHHDMDIITFQKSIDALKPYFGKCFSIGKNTANLSPKDAFPHLRNVGIEAEATMYEATGGINTHKGAIYSMGILCGSAGRLWTAEKPFSSAESLCKQSAELVLEAVKKDFEKIDASTAGGRLYLKYGLGGIRKEVASGFASVLNVSLPLYKNLRENGFNANDAGVIVLLHLIANVKDTNLYHRGGITGAEMAAENVRTLLAESPYPTKSQIEALDDAFIEKNLSPGGCADLLAVTYFLYELEILETDKKGVVE